MKACARCTRVVDEEEEEELERCVDCGRDCCDDCLTDDYRNFSYYDGSVDIVPVCRDCNLLVQFLQGNVQAVFGVPSVKKEL